MVLSLKTLKRLDGISLADVEGELADAESVCQEWTRPYMGRYLTDEEKAQAERDSARADELREYLDIRREREQGVAGGGSVMPQLRFTPGPWKPEKSYCDLYVTTENGRSVAMVLNADDLNEYANAYLIATAPEMYEYLEFEVDCEAADESDAGAEVIEEKWERRYPEFFTLEKIKNGDYGTCCRCLAKYLRDKALAKTRGEARNV